MPCSRTGLPSSRAGAPFEVAGKKYPAGSYVVKTAQAFRPHVMDMFEPQDHPHDFRYPGGPPNAPYDTTGWTLAYQMGVQFDRVRDGFEGPFTKIAGLLAPPPAAITGVRNPAGYLVSHRINNSFRLVNRLFKAGGEVYWLKKSPAAAGQDLGTGAIWIPASQAARGVLERGARELGVPVEAVAKAPAGEALKLKRIRIGLYDTYGGSMTSGWTRWVLEQFEFPFEVVYPQTLDNKDLNATFDVLLFTSGTIQAGLGRSASRSGRADNIPEEYRDRTGRITADITIPRLRKFVEGGGSLVAIGSSTTVAELFGLPVGNHLVEKGPDGRDRALSREKYFIPGSLLTAKVDVNNPLAYGMTEQAYLFFNNSPVFRLQPEAQLKGVRPVAWFAGTEPLASGWAWGQHYLDGGTAVAEAALGEGKVFLLGPEVVFRAQPHGTFKLLFNGLYYGSAKPAVLK